ncbi:MAG: mandelate racemase/muconate lactonizing enzyme family protein [Chloroflexi bacterium]|nr:mandelate racemase/muconate lactonizing enzyme family protein [Chloroflexota bacterium]
MPAQRGVNQLKIERIDVYQKTYTVVEEVYAWSRGRSVSSLDGTVVKLTTGEGLVGYGECVPLGPAYMPSYAEGVRTGVRELGPQLIGLDPLHLKAINTFMDSVMSGHGYVKTPIDIACWDLLGKATGQPISTLLGARYVEDFPIYRALSQGTPEEMVESAARYRAQGIRHFQMKVGGTADEDIPRIKAVLDSVQDGEVVVADANTGWNLHQATRVVNALRGERVYIEQPCPTLAECLSVRSRTSLPMVLDEVITGVPAFLEAYRQSAMDVINIKVSRVGGLTKAAQLRDLAQDLGVAVDLEDAASSDIMAAALAHLVASTRPEAFFTASIWNYRLRESISPDAPRPENGRVPVPKGPGLGITIDEEALGPPLFSIT